MSTIHFHQTTTSTPERYVAGLTDFGPGRSKLFGNTADEYLKVHHQGSLGGLALHLIGGCARIECRHNPGPNSDVGIFHARHVEDRLSTRQQEPQSQA